MTEIDKLLQAVDTYFDAIYYCDVDKLDQVFHPASSLFDADEGEIFVDPVARFREDVGSRPAPAGRGQARRDQIIGIDWLSAKSAIVKLRLQSHEKVFVDHLSFVNGKNGWNIVAKVWHLESTTDIVLDA
ncbi:MAG: nuclear transport factor 2 family protein [Pseudomonadota bacterium]